jgi:citrate lyase subunit beta / citryl-CoA lyase
MTTRLRSLLFAPAVRPDLLRKLPRSGADGVVIDCEDATPAGFKEEGRRNALEVGGDLVAAGERVFVRVNGVDTPWFAEDVVSGVPDGAAGVVVPMIESLEQLDRMESLIERTGRAGLPVIGGLETALGVATARQLLDHRVVTGAYFGAEDFIADMGGRRTDSNVEVLYARAEVALAGRLAGIPVLDQVVVAYRDDARFTREANEARAMGYAGKLCIHPAQVELAHAVFTPSADEVLAAKALVAAAEAASRSGSGVIVVDGRMIDGPLVEQARSVIAAAE